MRYFIIAGEASGDLHGSNLIKGLKKEDPSSIIRCWGGDLMQKAGGELIKHYKESAVMGFVEVAAKLGQITKNLKKCKSDILCFNPDVVILIDYPGFNLNIARFAHARKIPVFYYIAPKVWAWKESRIKLLKQYVDRLFIIFPFEIEYFKRHSIDAIYNGNPLLDSIDENEYAAETKEGFCKRNNISCDKEYIALLAGSRKNEIRYMLPRMTELCRIRGNYNFLLAAAPAVESSVYDEIIARSGVKNITVLYNNTYSIMKHSAAAVINSGTASLEGALIGVPQVVCYGGNEISYRIAKHFVKVKYISLANLILDKSIFRELIQQDCTAEKIGEELDKLLYDNDYRKRMLNDYSMVRKALGGNGASYRVAKRMIEEISIIKNASNENTCI